VIEIRVPRRSHIGLIAAAVVTVATVVAAAPAPVPSLMGIPTLVAVGSSKNVTGKDGKVPSTLVGDQYECTRTNPEMTIVDDSERGTVRLGTDPGHLKFDIKSSPGGHWQDAYISSGNNPDGYNSAQCNWLSVGKGYVVPIPVGKAGPLTASIQLHTVAGFEGDAGFDIWLTGPGQHTGYGTTSAMEEASSSSTEIMVWLNSPGIDRGEYHSLGYHTIDGRSWEVLYAGLHPWRYVVFAAPLATSKAVTVTDHNIHLFTLIRFAADHGWLKAGAELQAVDAGFEWYEDPTGGTQVEAYSLTGVK
jgi:hypothetical protein